MGSTLTIHNRTNVIINVALKHLGPVHWKNQLHPGETWTVAVGKVWFTLEIKIWMPDGSNDYSTSQAVIPILETALTIATVLPIAGSASTAVRAGVAGRKIAASIATSKSLWISALSLSHKFVSSVNSKDKSVWLKRYAVYMSSGKMIDVMGGPKAEYVHIDRNSSGQVTQTIDGMSQNLGRLILFEEGRLVSE